MRFELIDRVVERHPDRLVAVKSVTSAEEYLGDHFPGFPVLPGVMMLEALVQAGRLLLAGDAPADPTSRYPASAGHPTPTADPLVLTEVRNVRYGSMVRPGETLRVEVTLTGREGDAWTFTGTGDVSGQLAVQGRFRLAPLRTLPRVPAGG